MQIGHILQTHQEMKNYSLREKKGVLVSCVGNEGLDPSARLRRLTMASLPAYGTNG